jgi:hypothetical protein
MYACETWSLILREEFRLGVFKNRVLWGIFEHKRDEVTGKWRNLHNEELNNNNNNNITIYLTASWLSPGGRGYYAYTYV